MKDPEIRQAFKSQILSKIDDKVLILDELGLMKGDSIIDLAIIGESLLEGFEIKSGADSLARLPKQISFYNQVFDSITIILERNHLSKTLKIIPEFWGVIEAEKTWDGIVFKYYRKPQMNAEVKIRKKIDLLWKKELQEVAKSLGLKGYSTLRIKPLAKLICQNFPASKINFLIYLKLKNRKNWK